MARRVPPPLQAFLALALALSLGALFTARAAAALPKKYSPYNKLNVFTRVLSYIENNYVEEVDPDRLVHGAIRGMLSSLDPHSAFLDPQQYRDMKAETAGQFGGVGIEVEMREGALSVMSVFEGTPASRAGLLAGDLILQIDEQSTRGIAMDDAIARMRGRKGSKVDLKIGRKAWPEPRAFSFVRDEIRVENVTSRVLEPGYLYARVRQFQENTERDLAAALDRAEKEGGGRLAGLVLDLRNNPGGLLDEGVRVADLFIESGLIVKTEGKGGRVIDEERAHPRGTRLGFPIILLVNGGSASASEIVAGAMQDHGRGVVMGTQTFGKGSVQTIIELEDASALKLTIARYFTPKGRSIQEHGIAPDVVVEKLHLGDLKPDHTDEPDKKERDLAGHLHNSQPAGAARVRASVGDDHQLQTALDYLNAWRIFSTLPPSARPAPATISAGR